MQRRTQRRFDWKPPQLLQCSRFDNTSFRRPRHVGHTIPIASSPYTNCNWLFIYSLRCVRLLWIHSHVFPYSGLPANKSDLCWPHLPSFEQSLWAWSFFTHMSRRPSGSDTLCISLFPWPAGRLYRLYKSISLWIQSFPPSRNTDVETYVCPGHPSKGRGALIRKRPWQFKRGRRLMKSTILQFMSALVLIIGGGYCRNRQSKLSL